MKEKSTVIDYSIQQLTDQFNDRGYDVDGWAKNDREAKAVNMISTLDKCDLVTATILAHHYLREIGNWQLVCDIIRAELIRIKKHKK